VQFGFFVSPVAFSSNLVDRLPEQLRPLYALNPMVGVIDGFRWALLRGQPPLSFYTLGTSLAVILLFCVTGIWYFRKMERTFADVI
jgi:lipopolysaccharide transport system permease protein